MFLNIFINYSEKQQKVVQENKIRKYNVKIYVYKKISIFEKQKTTSRTFGKLHACFIFNLNC